MCMLGPTNAERRIAEIEYKKSIKNAELRALVKPKEYEWGYRFASTNNNINDEEYIAFKKLIFQLLGHDYDIIDRHYGYTTYSGDRYGTPGCIVVRTNVKLDILYIKMVSNFDLVEKINFKNAISSWLEIQQVRHEYDEEHIDQVITEMKRFSVPHSYRKSFGAKTPLIKLDILKTARKIIPYRGKNK